MRKGHKKVFFIFNIYYVALEIVTYVMHYTGYASLVNILLKFELIKAHLCSFRPVLGSYKITLRIFNVF